LFHAEHVPRAPARERGIATAMRASLLQETFMHRITARVLAVAGSLALSAAPALAQGTMSESGRPLKLGGMLGATLPIGDFGDIADVGFHVGALGAFARPTWPFALRGEITYHRNEAKDVDASQSILSFVPNIVWPFGMVESTARPYVIGGFGLHRVTFKQEFLGDEVSDTQTKFGFNVGGGFTFNLTGFDAFVEARFHSVLTEGNSANFIPLSFGFVF
jgi:hypothetical protein